eukprot:scaffold254625_cov13-Tisochrysis_lutea.AAC.1
MWGHCFPARQALTTCQQGAAPGCCWQGIGSWRSAAAAAAAACGVSPGPQSQTRMPRPHPPG